MSDSFHTALEQITRILKTSPGSPTVENLLRLASIYKFETFRERIENNLTRISIAGQILVMDIDFEERPTHKGQTRFHLHSVKLILANNEANFLDTNSLNGESVLKNSLTMYPDLCKFDLCLERLAAIDQYSVVEQGVVKIDCFEFKSEVADYLMRVFPGKVVVNPSNEFALEIDGTFKLYLQSDERLVTQIYKLQDGKLEKSYFDDQQKDAKTVGEVGFRVEFIQGQSFPMLTNMIKQLGLIVDESQRVELPDINDSYKSKKHGKPTTIQVFYLFESELVLIKGFSCGDILSVISTIKTLTKLKMLCNLLDLINEKCTLVDRFADIESEAVKLGDFLSKGSDMEVDHQFITVNASEHSFEIQGSDISEIVKLEDLEFNSKLQKIMESLELEVL